MRKIHANFLLTNNVGRKLNEQFTHLLVGETLSELENRYILILILTFCLFPPVSYLK